MIACVELPQIAQLCVVKWVGKTSLLTVSVYTFCGGQTDAADGVVQVPDSVFTEGKSWASVRTDNNGSHRVLKPCPNCKAHIR